MPPLPRPPATARPLAALLLFSFAALAAAQTTQPDTQPATQPLLAATAPADPWIVYFRADDASLWDTTAGDPATPNGYAQRIDSVPKDIRYVRLKRMDTGDAVIVPITPEFFPVRTQLPGQFVLWSGGQPTWRQDAAIHRFLGIAEYAFSARDKGDLCSWQSGSKGDSGYGGFGFGKVLGAPDQAYLWDNKPLPKTVFEIAVSSAELSDDDRKSLLRPGKLEVFDAKWGAPNEQVDVLKKLLPFAKNDGDLEMPLTVANLGNVPVPNGAHRELTVDFALNGEKKTLSLPETRNLWLIAPAIRSAAPEAPPIDRSAPVAPPVADPAGWTVLFRADDPALWNQDVGNPDMINGFAAAIDKLDTPVQYLRLRRLDTGESLIIPITKSALASGGPINGVMQWSAGTQTWRGARLLGIAQQAAPAAKPGELLVYRDALLDGGFRGWGFAKSVGTDFQQAFSWNGQPIDKTIFEIAVTGKPLTPAERATMPIPGKLTILNARWGPANRLADITQKLQGHVASGAIDLPIVAGDLFGPATPGQPRELNLSVDINGTRLMRKFKEGETLAFAAPVVLPPAAAAGPRGPAPTMSEIAASLDSGDYPATLKLIAQVLPLTGEAGRSYDRPTLLLQRAECLFQTKDRAGALASLQLAAREARDPAAAAPALAFAALLQRSPNGEFLNAGPKSPGIPILKPAGRKPAYEALWKEQMDLMTRHAAAATAASLPPLLQAAGEIPLARAAEFMATGASTKTDTHAANLARRAVTLINDELTRDSQRTEEIYNAAVANPGLKPDQAQELRNLLATCDQLPRAIADLTRSLANDALFAPLAPSLDKLRARIREVGTHKY